jgi:DNA-directed RNA polymerase subunit M/transcription elongation factor TFIIS
MKFCPLCFKLLLIESSTHGYRLICKLCRYFYPLTKQQKIVIQYAKESKLEVVEQNQEIKELPITQAMCPSCGHTKAYYEQRQTRSAD